MGGRESNLRRSCVRQGLLVTARIPSDEFSWSKCKFGVCQLMNGKSFERQVANLPLWVKISLFPFSPCSQILNLGPELC